MKKILGWMAAAAMGLGLLAGCNGGGGAALGPVDATSLEGKWYLRSSQEHGSTTTHLTVPKDTTIVTVINKDTTYTGTDQSTEIKSDGTYISITSAGANLPPATSTGTWTLSGNTLSVTLTGQTNPAVEFKVGISGGILTAVYNRNNTTTSAYSSITYDVTVTTTSAKQ
jgi:hypothetical protein